MHLQFFVTETKTNSIYSKALAECLVIVRCCAGHPGEEE